MKDYKDDLSKMKSAAEMFKNAPKVDRKLKPPVRRRHNPNDFEGKYIGTVYKGKYSK